MARQPRSECNPPACRVSRVAMKLPVLCTLLLLSSCLESRTYVTTQHRHLHYEVEVQRDIRREIRVTHQVSDDRLELRFEEHRFCRHVQYDVERMKLVRSLSNPGSQYYMMLGGLIAALSIPSYYMGFARSTGTARAIHFSVGTGIFLGPGLAIGGYGLFKRMEERTSVEDAGNVRREIRSTTFTCGKSLPAAGSRVELLTRIGHVPLGTMPEDGRILVDLSRIEPLRNEDTGRAYVDVFVGGNRVDTIVLDPGKADETPVQRP